MTHSDDDGLVLPPRIAPEQVVLLPVAMNEADLDFVTEYCLALVQELRKLEYGEERIRVGLDRSERRAGEKFWSAVKKGIPIRVEIGRREIESGMLSISRRDKPSNSEEKFKLSREEFLAKVSSLLEEMQLELLQRAQSFKNSHTRTINSLSELCEMFASEEESCLGFAVAFFDPAIESDPAVSQQLKSLKLTTRCIPFDQETITGKCIFSGQITNQKVIFARAY